MPGEARAFTSALSFLLRNRALLTWQRDVGGVADALAGGLLVLRAPIDAVALHSAWRVWQHSARDVTAVCDLVKSCVRGEVSVGPWAHGSAPLAPGSVTLLQFEAEHWVAVLRQDRRGWLMLDPDIGPVLMVRDALDTAPRTQIVVTPIAGAEGETTRSSGEDPSSLWHSLPEMLTGLAVRLLSAFLLALVCIALFQIQQGATLSSLLILVGLAALAGGGVILGRIAAFRHAHASGEVAQVRSFRHLLRGALRKRDLLGFRSQPEPAMAQRAMQRLVGKSVTHQGVGTALGACLGGVLLLAMLTPFAPLALALAAGALAVAHVADRVYVARPAHHGHPRQHRRLAVILGALHSAKMLDVLGGLAKWLTVALAGVMFATGGLSDVALTFWALSALIFLPGDVAHLNTVVKPLVLPARPALDSGLTMVPQRLPGPNSGPASPPALEVVNEPGVLYVSGLRAIMKALEQPDLTRAEQRAIACKAIKSAAPQLARAPALARLRPVFLGMSPEMTMGELDQVDLDTRIHTARRHDVARIGPEIGTGNGTGTGTVLARIDDRSRALVSAAHAGQTGADTSETAYLIALRTCGADELPVLFDPREQFRLDAVRRLGARAGCTHLGVLSMRRLVICEVSQ